MKCATSVLLLIDTFQL
uniref:Uncharacterized protein n=1 Tax=Anguilla anguilla TaxID=7936 RepID=A0A0E9W1W1_ANGAN